MGRATILAPVVALLAGCGTSPDYVKPRLRAMSDQELMRAWVQSNDGLAPHMGQQDEWIFEEMQRRGLVRAQAAPLPR